MNTTELTEHLRAATNELAPPPGFPDAVLRGGRRRRARRRLAVAATAVVVAALAAGTTVVTLREDAPVPVADARLTTPTKGGLAGDQGFLDQARAAWVDGLRYAPEARHGYYDDARGEPHVYWAGETPAGRAAVVLQQFSVHPTGEVVENGLYAAEGLVAVDPQDGDMKLVDTRVIGSARPGQADYYKFGPEDRTMLIVDYGEPLHYSFETAVVDRQDGGRDLRYDWQRAEPRDGVAIVTIPDDWEPEVTMAAQGDDPPTHLPAGDLTYYRKTASDFLALRLDDPSYRVRSSLLRWGDAMFEVGEPLGLTPSSADAGWGWYRYFPGEPDVTVSPWTIVAGLPDGRLVFLKERQRTGAKPRLVARVAASAMAESTELVDGGVVDSDAVLPVRFPVPGGGWIVADKGKELSYRTAPDAPWQKAGRDAALLPVGVTEVLADHLYVRLQ